MLICHIHRKGQPTEAEPVTVMATDKTVWFVTDEGTEIAFDAGELRCALDQDVLAEDAA